MHGTQSEEGASKVPRAQMEPQLRHLIAAERTAPAALMLSPTPPPPFSPFCILILLAQSSAQGSPVGSVTRCGRSLIGAVRAGSLTEGD